jgi:hypothetical protein
VVDLMFNDDLYADFRYPVTGLANYAALVAQPMDLSTVRANVVARRYRYIEDFDHDIDRILRASEAFNGKQHPITKRARQLRKRTDEFYHNNARALRDLQARVIAEEEAAVAAARARAAAVSVAAASEAEAAAAAPEAAAAVEAAAVEGDDAAAAVAAAAGEDVDMAGVVTGDGDAAAAAAGEAEPAPASPSGAVAAAAAGNDDDDFVLELDAGAIG